MSLQDTFNMTSSVLPYIILFIMLRKVVLVVFVSSFCNQTDFCRFCCLLENLDVNLIGELLSKIQMDLD